MPARRPDIQPFIQIPRANLLRNRPSLSNDSAGTNNHNVPAVKARPTKTSTAALGRHITNSAPTPAGPQEPLKNLPVRPSAKPPSTPPAHSPVPATAPATAARSQTAAPPVETPDPETVPRHSDPAPPPQTSPGSPTARQRSRSPTGNSTRSESRAPSIRQQRHAEDHASLSGGLATSHAIQTIIITWKYARIFSTVASGSTVQK